MITVNNFDIEYMYRLEEERRNAHRLQIKDNNPCMPVLYQLYATTCVIYRMRLDNILCMMWEKYSNNITYMPRRTPENIKDKVYNCLSMKEINLKMLNRFNISVIESEEYFSVVNSKTFLLLLESLLDELPERERVQINVDILKIVIADLETGTPVSLSE